MKKRILALALAAALIALMLPTFALADDTPAPVYLAAYCADIRVDGSLSETGWLTDGRLSDGSRFGVLWDSGSVYLAAAGTGEMTVKLGDRTLTVAADGTTSGVTGASAAAGTDAMEAAIPYTVSNYSNIVPLTVTRGEASWEGTLTFSSQVRETVEMNYSITGTAPVDSDNLGSEEVSGGFRMYSRYKEDAANVGSARVYAGTDKSALSWLSNRSVTLTMEYDFTVNSMPEYASWMVARTYCCFGFSMAVTDVNGGGYVAGITNTADGLRFCVMKANGEASVPMGKQVGDTFHIRQDWTAEGDLAVYVDGVLLHTFEKAELTADEAYNTGWKNKNIIIFNLWGDGRDLTSDGGSDIDFTYSNLKMGTVSVTHALEDLDFDDIKGTNSSASLVSDSLTLPDTWTNGQLAAQKINWSSSAPEIIAADGTVTPAIDATEVTLTASLESDTAVTKSIAVSVPRKGLKSVYTDGTITVDGTRATAEAWPTNMEIGNKDDSAPFGGIASRWYQEKLYFFINYTRTPKTVTLSLADNSWTLDLSQTAVNSGALTGVVTEKTVELCLDLKAAGLKLLDYGMSYDFQVELTGDNGTAKLEERPIALRFVIEGDSVTAIGSSMVNTDLVKNFTYENDTFAIKLTGTNTRDYLFTKTLTDMDNTKDMRLDQTVTVNAMPVSDGAIVDAKTAQGYYFILSDEKNSNGHYTYIFANLFNSASNGLTLRILVDGVSKNYAYDGYEDIVLGKHVGDTFDLGLRWNADETAVVYVDGKQVGSSIEGATLITSGISANAVQLNYKCTTAGTDAQSDLVITDVKLTKLQSYYTSIKEEITKDRFFAGVDLKAVSENLTLPTTFDSEFLGQLPLSWVSEKESIIDTDGTVSRPEGTRGQYVTLSLYVGEQKLFSVYPYVLPQTVVIPTSPDTLGAAFSAAQVVVDGATTDEGWSMNTELQTASGEQLGRLGAQWDVNNLYLAVETGGEELTITLDQEELDLSSAVTADHVLEIAIPFDTAITEYGKEIAAEITLGDAVWEGTIILSSKDWFATSSTAPYPNTPATGSTIISGVGFDEPTANQGVTKLTDGWQFYDTYDPEGSNPRQVRSYVIYQNNMLLDDRSADTYVEFDFYAAAMPEYTEGEATRWESRWACYGLSWLINTVQDANKMADSIAVGIYNSPSGLVFVALGDDTYTVPLNRQVGDLFRIGVRWNTDDSISVFLDEEKIAEFEDMTVSRRAMGTAAVNLNLVRSAKAAESFSDNFDISVTNLAFGKAYGDKLMDSLTFDTIRGENADPYAISSDLDLPETLSNAQLDTDINITWSCSDPAVISADGRFTQPETGKLITLTAAADNGTTKEFELYAVGKSLPEDVLYVKNDLDTAKGVGQKADFYHFTLDATNNSVIRDLKESKTVNVIALHDSDAENRLNESTLTVWVSDDNVFYTKVDSFKLLRAGETVYLYDFEATGRYIKVHCTHYDSTEADFTAPVQSMIDVYYEDVFGANGGAFTESTVTVANTDTAAYDTVWTLEGEYQRVLLGSELLYHYTESGKTFVRIPEIAPDSSVTLTVLSGNSAALDISNKEYTYEVVYGTREVVYEPDARWLVSLPDGRLLNIVVLDEDMDGLINNYIAFNWSYDGGLTWTEYQPTGFDYNHCKSIAGVLYDPDVGEQGRIIAQGYHNVTFDKTDGSKSDCKTRFIYSDDLGETWHAPEEEITILGPQTNYYLTYTAPYKLSSADGEGENIDYVLPLGTQSCDDTTGSFVGRVAYSSNAGLSWTMGESEIRYEGEGMLPYESGVSEGTILETADGTLVYYGRCQFESMNYFATATSQDHGKTWSAGAASKVYTVNTQPLFHEFGDTALLTWAGNTALGGNSYKRYPLNVAYSTDGLRTFVNIQNLWSRYSLQNLGDPLGSKGSVTNQSVTSVGDSLLVTWSYHLMKVDHFTDYFFRTKGAYDSFETASAKYEGWTAIVGTVAASEDQSHHGIRSMKIVDSSSAVRSIPYVQDGTVAFDLYLEDLDGTLQIELESAYSDVFGEAAPIALEIADGKLNGLSLKEGWNKIAFDLALTEGTASLTVNDQSTELEPNIAVGDYICYVEIGNGTTVCYVDEFQVVDNDPQTVPEAPESPIPQQEPEISYKSVSLKGNIGVNYYMTLPQDVASDENAYMQFTVEGKEPVKIPVSDAIQEVVDNKAYYVFTCQVAAKEMNDVIEATFVYGDGQTIQVKDFSVRAYADQILADTSGEYDDVKSLVEAMLRYGAYAQLHFDYNTEETADVDMGTAAVSAVTAETLAAFAGSGTGTDTAVYCGNSLLLKSETSLRFFFQVADGAALSVKCGDDTLTATERNGMHYVAVENISAKDLDTKYTLNANGAEITASALTYAYNVLSAADGTYDDNLENLVKALYLYNQAANTYFDNN